MTTSALTLRQLHADNSETEISTSKLHSTNTRVHFLNEPAEVRSISQSVPVTLSIACVYPCVLPFTFFPCEHLPSGLTDIPERFHKSQPQKAINNAWDRWKRVRIYVHNLPITPITTIHALSRLCLPANHQTPTNSRNYLPTHPTDGSCRPVQSTPPYLHICKSSSRSLELTGTRHTMTLPDLGFMLVTFVL
jgi:hypothetical protein